MKAKKILLVFVLFVALVAGWLYSIKATTGVEKKAKQEKLVKDADEFVSKELYVRAIPLYVEALEYGFNRDDEIEQKLLSAYEKNGNKLLYAKLVEDRLNGNRASEKECLKVAQFYMETQSLKNAMKVAKKAVAIYPTGEMNDYYEQHRYEYTLRTSNYLSFVPTKVNELMPAYDGKKWGFADDSGKESLAAIYDKVVPFNDDGYAAVKLSDKYYVIRENGDKYGVAEGNITDIQGMTSKSVIAKAGDKYGFYDYDFKLINNELQFEQMTGMSDGLFAAKKNGKWGILKSDGKVIADFMYEDVAVNSLGKAYANGVAMVKKDGKWNLIGKDGKKVFENGFAMAKAPEADGYVAVANEGGKWGFINHKGEVVIDYQYDDAYSFSDDLAAVKKVNEWYYISKYNKTINKETFKEAKPFHKGIAQVIFTDSAGLVKLNNYEK